MAGLLVAGTSSDAGKSLIVAGMCRAFARRGLSVAPFKAQNMSNNSMVCPDGSEIGRAQYLQALAAGVEPSAIHNPVLLKPATDRRSFVVLRGQPGGALEAGEYATGRKALAAAAFDSYRELAARHELVIAEGAGSPAEINLRSGDYVNLGLAREFDLPVVLVGDIDRGGVLASIFGHWAILQPPDRRCLAGYLINKFRGDQSVLDPGLRELSARTGLENFGVLPWLDQVWLDSEDALAFAKWPRSTHSSQTLRIAAIQFPRISNATDLDALAAEPGLDVFVTDSPAELERADLVVLPGSRSTLADLEWLRQQGLAEALQQRAAAGRPILGICGGYQMLCELIDDPVESSRGIEPGLGLLPARVQFRPEKSLGRPHGSWRGHPVVGYEIHHGVVEVTGGEPFLDGVRQHNIWGTIWHGAFENDAFRRAWLNDLAHTVGSTWRPQPGAVGFAERRTQMLDELADALETHVNLDAILRLARAGAAPLNWSKAGRTASSERHGSAAYLAGLLLQGRKVVVVGGGRVNARRIPRLLAAGARVTLISPAAQPELAELAAAGKLDWHQRDFVAADLDGAWFVLTATTVAEVNAAVAQLADERHLFCVRADRADLGSAWTAATAEIGDATLGVLANRDPRRSKLLRDQLFSLLELPSG